MVHGFRVIILLLTSKQPAARQWEPQDNIPCKSWSLGLRPNPAMLTVFSYTDDVDANMPALSRPPSRADGNEKRVIDLSANHAAGLPDPSRPRHRLTLLQRNLEHNKNMMRTCRRLSNCPSKTHTENKRMASHTQEGTLALQTDHITILLNGPWRRLTQALERLQNNPHLSKGNAILASQPSFEANLVQVIWVPSLRSTTAYPLHVRRCCFHPWAS